MITYQQSLYLSISEFITLYTNKSETVAIHTVVQESVSGSAIHTVVHTRVREKRGTGFPSQILWLQ